MSTIQFHIKELLRKCPVCRNGSGEILHTQKFTLPDNHPLPDQYDVTACTACGFVFADTPADQGSYNIFYQNMSKYEDTKTATGGGESEYDLKRLQITCLDIMNIRDDKNSSILDVGCGNGGLLLELKKNGYANLTGLDPSPVCVNNIRAKGIQAQQGGLFPDNYGDDSGFVNMGFDLVILSHVFEHIRDLQTAVAAVKKLLNDRGSVYIEVPDASRYPDHYIVPYYYFDIEHINHFDENSLSNLVIPHQFELTIFQKKNLLIPPNTEYPAVFAVFQRNSGTVKFSHHYSPAVKESVIQYVKLSKERESFPQIEELAKSGERIIVWGAGSFAQRLLKTTKLGECNIIAYVDGDTKKYGLRIKDVEIFSPAVIREYDCPIIICSALGSDDIVREICSMNVQNKIIVMK